MIHLITTLFTLLTITHQLTSNPTWLKTNLINTGILSLTASGTFNVTYKNGFSTQPKRIIYSIIQLDFNSTTQYLNFTNKIKTQQISYFSLIYSILGKTQIFSLTINYMTFDNSIIGVSTNNAFSLQSQVSIIKKNLNNLTYGSGYRYVNIANNYTITNVNHQNLIQIFITGVSIYRNFSNWNFTLLTGFLNNLQYLFGGATSQGLSISDVSVCRLIIDRTIIQQNFIIFVDMGLINNSSNFSINMNKNLGISSDSDYFIGLKNFVFNHSDRINFAFNVNKFQFTFSSNANQLEFFYFYYRIRNCSANLKYFFDQTKLCYNVCDAYYYSNNNNYLCISCNYFCQHCDLSTNNFICTSCQQATNRMIKNNKCICKMGFFDENNKNCSVCNQICVSCINSSECIQYYSRDMQFKFRANYINYNKFKFQIEFSQNFENKSDLNQIMKITYNNIDQNYSIIQLNNKSITIQIQNTQQYLNVYVSIAFKNLTITNQQNQYLKNTTTSIIIPYIFYFSSTQILLLQKLKQICNMTQLGYSYIFIFFTLTSLLYIILGMIKFIQTISLYLFLIIQLPPNLLFFMKQIYSIQSFSIIVFPNPIQNLIQSNLPQIYLQMSITSNFLQSHFYDILEIIILVSLYELLCFIIRKINIGKIIKFIKMKFFQNQLQNLIIILLSFQIPFAFSASVGLLDFSNIHIFKLLNLIICPLLLFFQIILSFFIYIYLKKNKFHKSKDLSQLYQLLKKKQDYSQIVLLADNFVDLALAIFIPLMKTRESLAIIFFILQINMLITCYNTHVFKNRFRYYLRVIFNTIHLFFHLLIIIIYYKNIFLIQDNLIVLKNMGYIGIICIISNCLINLIQIGLQVIENIKQFFKDYFVRKNKIQIQKIVIINDQLKNNQQNNTLNTNETAKIIKSINFKSRMAKFLKVRYN